MGDRSDTRVAAAIGVVLTVGNESEMCTTRNISRGGALLLTQRPLPAGTPVHLDIVYGQWQLALAATVVTAKANGFGVKFLRLSQDAKAQLDTLVRDLIDRTGSDRHRPASVQESQVKLRIEWAWLEDVTNAGGWERAQRRADLLTSLSLSGAAIVTEMRPAVGEILAVRLGVKQVVSCRAEVVRFTSTGFAVKFGKPTDAFRKVVAEILDQIRLTDDGVPSPAG